MPTPLPNNNRPSDKKPNTFKFNLWWMYLIVLVFLAGLFYFDQQTVSKEVSYTTFEQYVERDHGIADIVVFTDKKRVEGRLTDSLANVLFPTVDLNNKGARATVEANIPSADKLQERIEYWRSTGAFTGDVEY